MHGPEALTNLKLWYVNLLVSSSSAKHAKGSYLFRGCVFRDGLSRITPYIGQRFVRRLRSIFQG
jgi:hypothetical protein